MTARVLVVDDEPAVRRSVERSLRYEGYEVLAAGDGASALRVLRDEHPDLVVLDVTLPGFDGLAVCRRIRSAGDRTAVLMLTARDTVAARVAGLDAGADDYLVKPFALEEMLARVRALLRRASPATELTPVAVHGVRLDPAARTASRGGRELVLTRTESVLLELLLRHAGEVLSRSRLYEEVWGVDLHTSSNSLDVYIGYLRRKLEAGGEPRLVQTVRGVGFVLRP